jgi:hypothetical protein
MTQSGCSPKRFAIRLTLLSRHLRDGREILRLEVGQGNTDIRFFSPVDEAVPGRASRTPHRRTPHMHSPVNMGAYLTMICEVCKICQATIHGMPTGTGNGEVKRLRHFCSTCFEVSNGLDITRLEEDLECDIAGLANAGLALCAA